LLDTLELLCKAATQHDSLEPNVNKRFALMLEARTKLQNCAPEILLLIQCVREADKLRLIYKSAYAFTSPIMDTVIPSRTAWSAYDTERKKLKG
jgi:hypothetical protein